MTEKPRFCIERIIPGDLEAAGMKFWAPGQTLSVSFLDGHPLVKAKVRYYARKWLRFANVRFRFLPSPNPAADIRISFLQDGSWSALGRDARNQTWFPQGEPTMNYGWLEPDSANEEFSRVVLHEFGHALGLIHEHQTPAGGIRWNEAAVLRDLSGPPNNWDEPTIRHNVLDKYSSNLVTQFTQFDPRSIMLYAFPSSWTLDNMTFPSNKVLSATDKTFIAERYPHLD
jgi:hypothetical protein